STPSEYVVSGQFSAVLAPNATHGVTPPTPADDRSGCDDWWLSSWSIDAGQVTGSLPPGFTLPCRTFAVAYPPRSPGYHISSTAFTLSSQGNPTGWPLLSTTTVLGLTAAMSSISAS